LKLPGFFFSALAFISTAVGCSEYKEYHSRPDVKPRLVHEPLNATENVRQAAGVIPGFDVSYGLRFNPRAYEIKTFKLQFGKSK
jgi:hypothetical protein